MNKKELEDAYPWLRVPEDVDREGVLERFKQSMDIPSVGWPSRILGQESFLRDEALTLKQYLLSVAPQMNDDHWIYRSREKSGILICVDANGTFFNIAGAPPLGPFWKGDFADGPAENPRCHLRRNQVGDRFLTKLAARTDGQGFESESESTYESHPDGDKLIVKTDVRDLSPTPSHTIRRAVVRQDQSGECYEYGPLGEEFERPVVSRRSPMAVGQYYSVIYYFFDLCCEEYITVEAFEEVTVPAGTFEAFRLKLQSPLPERTSWFAPALNATIKETVNCEGYTSMEVLHEYCLSAGPLQG